MSFMGWVKNVFSTSAAPMPALVSAAVEQAPANQPDEIEGLNFRKAVDAHQVWKTRLTGFINGTAKDNFDWTLAGRADQCVLGKWMVQVGDAKYFNEKLYLDLKKAHVKFHENAEAIIQTANRGDKQNAMYLLTQGDYPKYALRITSLLARLYHRCQSGII